MVLHRHLVMHRQHFTKLVNNVGIVTPLANNDTIILHITRLVAKYTFRLVATNNIHLATNMKRLLKNTCQLALD